MPRNPQRLDVFHLADALVLDVYQLTRLLPETERCGRQGQRRRAAISVAANIVEGSQRSSTRDRLRFLEVAAGSANEAGYLASVTRRLALLAPAACEDLEERYNHVTRALERLRQRIAKDADTERKA
jgi:four helix bundle protein